MIFPDSDRTPLIRTDFSSEEAWQRVIEAVSKPSPEGFNPNLHLVNDRSFEGADPNQIAGVAGANSDHVLLIIADSRTMNDQAMPLLCVDPIPPGGQFRSVPAQLWSVENNVSLANMDFCEFVAAVDSNGVFRGFSD